MDKICIIGLGYVGLPILMNLSKAYTCIGYDNKLSRVKELNKGIDIFNEYKINDIRRKNLKVTNVKKILNKYNIFIITVPTPIKKNKDPDLSHLKDVCLNLSSKIKKADIIIFESTVYPGLTENFCIPLLEKKNKLKEGTDFFVGYSPERVNPGDKSHELKNINKILAYPYNFKLKSLKKIYSKISKKVILTKNIREAETAKVIENIQRDVNIGLVNEIYLACQKLKINFNNVINLASTKWNFLKFEPGLVGGHCLPVDPYYFADICKKNNFKTQITLAGRNINDSMKNDTINRILLKLNNFREKKVLICGLSYKKNVADLRNSLAFDIFKLLSKRFKNIKGYDPLLNKRINIKNNLISKDSEFIKFDIFILMTPHDIIIKRLKRLKNKKIIKIFN